MEKRLSFLFSVGQKKRFVEKFVLIKRTLLSEYVLIKKTKSI